MAKLFTHLDLENFNKNDLIELLDNSNVFLTFKWTEGRKIVIYKLHLKVDTGATFDVLKGTAVADSDGDKTFELGSYKDGSQLEISFGILAMMDVPRAIAIISQTNPDKVNQGAPKDAGKTEEIKSGKKWEASFKYTVE